jgi:hypothetical protein
MNEILEILKLVKDPAILLSCVFIYLMFKMVISRDEAQKQLVDQLSNKINQLSEMSAGLTAIINLCCVGSRRKDGDK